MGMKHYFIRKKTDEKAACGLLSEAAGIPLAVQQRPAAFLFVFRPG